MLATDGQPAWLFPQREDGHNIHLRLDALGVSALRNPQSEYQRYCSRMMLNCYRPCSLARPGGTQ
jgi:hypothetical protein